MYHIFHLYTCIYKVDVNGCRCLDEGPRRLDEGHGHLDV
jgi:hypothetical protein